MCQILVVLQHLTALGHQFVQFEPQLTSDNQGSHKFSLQATLPHRSLKRESQETYHCTKGELIAVSASDQVQSRKACIFETLDIPFYGSECGEEAHLLSWKSEPRTLVFQCHSAVNLHKMCLLVQ